MKTELVQDWMSDKLITVTPDTTLPEADKLMRDRGIRRLPVVENGRLVGLITSTDVRDANPSDATSLSIWEMNYLLSQLKVREIMAEELITVAGDASISEAAQLMLLNKIGGLPVLDEAGNLIGIITESDIFRLVVQAWARRDDEAVQPFAHYDG